MFAVPTKVRFSFYNAFTTWDVGGDMFSNCPSTAFVRSSRQILLPRYLTIEWLELSRWNLQGIFTSPYTDDWLDSGGQRSRSQQAVEVVKTSTSTL